MKPIEHIVQASPAAFNLEVLRRSDGISRLNDHLAVCDQWFRPRLSSRVNLNDFATKLINHGEVIFAVSSARDVGVAAFYCNDFLRSRAFLSHLAVDPSYRRSGIGRAMLEQAKRLAHSSRMKSMWLEVSSLNGAAIRFYESNGFIMTTTSSVTPGSFQMFCTLQE